MHVSKLSEFIQSDVPSNTLLLIPNEFGTVFELGVQRLERLFRRTRNTIFAGIAKPERETISHDSLLEALTTRILFACLLPFLYRCNPLHINILNSTTILVHRITVHM